MTTHDVSTQPPANGSASVPDAPSPVPLMQLASGFWAFKTLAAAAELDLFSLLAGGRVLTKDEIGANLGLQERPTDQLLAGCASIGLLRASGGGYTNSPLSEQFLVPSQPTYFGGFVRFVDQVEYLPWFELVRALKTNRPITYDPDTQESVFTTTDPKMLDLFWTAMHSISSGTARALDRVHDFTGHRALLDVGGGTAAFPIHLCQTHPRLRAAVFDLPLIQQAALDAVAAAGLTDRIGFQVGDFTREELPAGYDVLLLSNILHDWDEATGRMLVGKCRAALPPGGQLLICELMLTADRSGPPSAALMGLNMIVETAGGRNYSHDELAGWLLDAGFATVDHLPMDAAGATGVLVASVGAS
ncbi:MAG TPA: methyltransferase [Mycobacteriales bacterium]|nr:methyltransferase [Mycobacteriales bacterium]